ncbi:MAG: galactokinase [Planctomycetia bacterium]|nr:galactokinase [Planctomycetia bacterium]
MSACCEILLSETQAAFEEKFGRVAKWIVTAPGRVNIIGEHTDYNEGFVFPMAIEKNIIIAAAPALESDGVPDEMARFYSLANGETVDIRISGDIQPTEEVKWWSYIQGVIAGCLQREVPMMVKSFVAVIHCNIPIGGGLSSSAALEMSTATLMEEMSHVPLDKVEKALIGQKAEHDYARMPCGIMDQFISSLAEWNHLMLLDCRSYEYQLVPFHSQELSILIIDSKVKHELVGGEYAERRASCFSAAEKLGVKFLRDLTLEQLQQNKEKITELEYRRARHGISEDVRTLEAAEALKNKDYDRLGELMYASHDSLRDDYEVSCAEIDILVEIAREIGKEGGVYGCRMTGGGFGGCAVALVETDKVDAIMDKILQDYKKKTGVTASLFVSRPARGAHVIL